ncbi:calponin homology domain-containing protein DDB_G0272472-like isoform X3 [Mytilus edulis]|uniref:calponin homology domain-containing protein DDB_G0272472-like isoform X3 n=1 Tax=Mytilus edulis TaxID=6550 RepID=UPI0039F12C52
MGELLTNRSDVLKQVFSQYDHHAKDELTPIQVQMLYGDLRMGSVSLPQVVAAMKYVCVTGSCVMTELYNLLQELDRRYFLLNDFRWEFSMLDRNQTDCISEDKARWMVQAVHGKYFSKRKWEYFVTHRPAPGSGVSFAEIEVMLCDIPNRMETLDEQNEAEKERDAKLRRQRLADEEIEREKERLRKEREEQRRRKDEENKRLEGERIRKLNDDEDYNRQIEKERRKEEERLREEEELRRLKELEEKQRLERERRQKEEEELYKDVEKLARDAKEEEKNAKNEEDQRRLRHKRIRYDLKVAMKTRDTYKLKYTINEFKTEKVEDKDMDLIKAEKLLKEIGCRDDLKRAMTHRELEELARAIETVKKHGFEVELSKELLEANQLLTRLRRLERIRHEILQLKQSTVAEIRSYQSPPQVVHTVMTSTFLLLGHKEKETKIWKTVQALVGKTGKEGLKRRCIECKPDKINVTDAKRAQALMEKYELDEIRDVSAGAATFYVWSITMIEELMDIIARKEEAAAAKQTEETS